MKRPIYLLSIVALAIIAKSLLLQADDAIEIPLTTNLSADTALSQEKNLPIMLMISGIDCPFCHRLKNDYLNPIMHNPDYQAKVIMRELIIDDGGSITDFNGTTIDSSDISRRYDAELTPTLLFVNHQGTELTKRVIGYSTPEMYGYYLDKAIDSALANLKSGNYTHN